jgi:hypothetical protein
MEKNIEQDSIKIIQKVKLLEKDYLIRQLKGMILILEGDPMEGRYNSDYIDCKFERILSGQGIRFHALIEEQLNNKEE